MPAGLLSGAVVANIVETLSHNVAESLSAPLPNGVASAAMSMACVIETGPNSVTRIEVQAARSVARFPSVGGPVPTAQIDQPLDNGLSAQGAYSLPDSRRAEELISSARRALRLADVRAAQKEGGKLEEVIERASQGQIPPAALAEGFNLLCDIEVAVIEHGIGPRDAHLARAERFLERAKHVHNT